MIQLASLVSEILILYFAKTFFDLSIFNCSTSYLLRPAALPIVGWLASINPNNHGANHGWNRCKKCLYVMILGKADIILFHIHMYSLTSLMAERHCKCNFYNAVSFGRHNDTAFLLWHQTTFSSREFLCVFSTSIGYHKC